MSRTLSDIMVYAINISAYNECMGPVKNGHTRKFGVHVSIAGGLSRALERAHALGCATFQIFSHSPRSWQLSEIPPEEARLFRAGREKLALDPVFIHACYLLNLSSADAALREKSAWMLGEELRRADVIGADYVVIHSGRNEANRAGRIEADIEEGEGGEDGHILFIESIKSVIGRGKEKKNKKFRAGLLLENTAEAPGAGLPARSVKALSLAALECGAAGICFDTCHGFASGYDITSAEGMRLLARQTLAVPVRLIHLNDSRGQMGSGLDRHEHLGKGGIGLEGFRHFLGYGPPFKDVPVIMETPKKNEGDDPMNLETARALIESKSTSGR